ncbi:MAG: transposase [Bacilli bacterium]|nr:transposase [Bacilli bacterium]
MAKEIHVAQATNFRGIVLAKRHLPFTNNLEGFEKLQRWVEDLQQKYQLKNLKNRNIHAAKRFFKKVVSSPHNQSPRVITVDKNP